MSRNHLEDGHSIYWVVFEGPEGVSVGRQAIDLGEQGRKVEGLLSVYWVDGRFQMGVKDGDLDLYHMMCIMAQENLAAVGPPYVSGGGTY